MKSKLLDNMNNKIVSIFEQLENIESDIDSLATKIANIVESKKGRVVFVGAGISADMAKIIIDEMWFNFQIDNERFLSITAAKSYAGSLEKWKELEEMPSVSVFELEMINLNNDDLLIGLSSSGKTQYVISALEYANNIGCETAIITDVNGLKDIDCVNNVINTNFGKPSIRGLNTAEGSTIQKIVIDNILYLAMEKCGRIYDGSLIFMKPVSMKIENYCIDVLSKIFNIDNAQAKELLYKYNKSLEVAIIAEKLNVDEGEAKLLLVNNNYNFSKILD